MARKKYNKRNKTKEVLWFLYDFLISLLFLGFMLYLGNMVLLGFK